MSSLCRLSGRAKNNLSAATGRRPLLGL
jgi:hypothetical protein